MTTPVAVIGLTYDGTDVQHADLGIFLEIYRGLNEQPSVRGKDTVVPSLAYRVPRNRVADSLTVELRGSVRGLGADVATQLADFRDKVDALRSLFSSTRSPADLVAGCEDGTTRTISCRPLPSQVWAEVDVTEATVSIELEAYEDWSVIEAGA